MAARHVLRQLPDLTPEGAHHPDARERLPDPAIDALDILPHRPVDGPHALGRAEADQHRARDDGHGHEREPPVEVEQDANRHEQPDDRERRRDHGALQQASGRINVTRQAGQDPAGLHVPQPCQRQVQQPVEQRATQRKHHADIQQSLPEVLEGTQQV